MEQENRRDQFLDREADQSCRPYRVIYSQLEIVQIM